MAQHQYTPATPVILGRPSCTKCGSLMWLARIEPDSPGHDRRTFECPVCETSEIVVVEFKSPGSKANSADA